MKLKPIKQVTLLADADDSLITLNRVISLLRSRRFAIVSVAAAQTHSPGVVRLTIVIEAERTRSDRVAACLAKLADVWNVTELDPAQTEALVSVRHARPAGRGGLTEGRPRRSIVTIAR